MFHRDNCRWTSSRLWDYANAGLSERDKARIEAHVTKCASCRRDAEEYRTTSALMDAYRTRQPRAERDGWHELRSRLDAGRSQAPGLRAVLWAPALAVCGIAATACVCWVAAQTHGVNTPAEKTAWQRPAPPAPNRNNAAPNAGAPETDPYADRVPKRLRPNADQAHPTQIQVATDATPPVRQNKGRPRRASSRIPTVAWKVQDVKRYEANEIRTAVLANVNEDTGSVRLVPVAIATPVTTDSDYARYTPGAGTGSYDTDVTGGNE